MLRSLTKGVPRLFSEAKDPKPASDKRCFSPSDIVFKYSIGTGPGNSVFQGDAYDSVGGWMSNTKISVYLVQGRAFNLFGKDWLEAESRCVFVHNTHPSITLQDARCFVNWVTEDDPAQLVLGLDQTGNIPANSASLQAHRLSQRDEEPPAEAVVFASHIEKGKGLRLGDLPPGYARAIWMGRFAMEEPCGGVNIRVEGDVALF